MKLFDELINEPLVKEVSLGKLKLKLVLLSKKDFLEITNISLKKDNIVSQSEDIKMRTLAKSIMTINGRTPEEYDEIEKSMESGESKDDAIVGFLYTLPDTYVNILYSKYIEIQKQFNSKLETLKKN